MKIYDDFLSLMDFAVLYPHFAAKGFVFTHRSDSSKQNPHLGQHAYYCTEEERGFIENIVSKLGYSSYRRAYVQIYTPSDTPFWHHDSTHNTVVYFLHQRYSADWGGELLTCKKDSPYTGSFLSPLPNRLVNFNGLEWWHAGRPFNRWGECYRMVLVINIDEPLASASND